MITSERNSTEKVRGQYFVTYTATRFNKKYTAVHTNPCGSSNDNNMISADELNQQWLNRYKGLCPFNGDTDFEVVRIQQRYN